MEVSGPILTTSDDLRRENDALRVRMSEAENNLAEAQELIRAIHSGDVDAVIVSGPEGDQVFTLKDAEFAYRALVEAMNEGAATVDVDGTVLYCNQRLSDLLGVSLEQIIGSPMANLVSSQTMRVFDALLAHARTGEPSTAGLELQSAEGRCISVQLSMSEMKSIEPITFCMVVTDLTERNSRDELIAAGKLSASILESAAEAIAVCDEAGTVIAGNAALENLCGCNPIFQPFSLVLPLELADGSAAPAKRFSISDALGGRSLIGQEVLLRRNGDRAASLLLSASPIRSSYSIAGCVLTMTDITQRKRAEEALLRSEKLASVGRMASTIAHEINNPLEAVGQLLYLVMINPQITPEIKSYLDLAVQELDRVSHITQQALAFHRDTGAPALIDLRDSIDGVLKLYSRRLEARGIEVETRYRGEGMIKALGGEIRQVIANLLSNSLDALPNGGRIQMRLSTTNGKDDAPRLRFSIGDNGSGIPVELQRKIFEPFFTTKDTVGIGLGLWVSKQLIEKQGANIQVRSRPGRGTVFSITFRLDGSGIAP